MLPFKFGWICKCDFNHTVKPRLHFFFFFFLQRRDTERNRIGNGDKTGTGD